MSEAMEMVTLIIDDVEVTVPKGTNLIEAAEAVGVEIPHYCYHQRLSIVGNCRMCQVKIEGMPKLTIACNTTASDGMVVRTHQTSEEVAEAQRATLEFLLINHPLDCTVCDQAGHCKLQDYYYKYNLQASRFTESKVHKPKAQTLGSEIVYDGERCIMCKRCVRFCDEITGTGELAAFNRGDKAVIDIFPGKELNNPLSGTVADLCPVGALTHRRWRFNSRIWFTNQINTICPGCSTGCNVKVAVRDERVVHVKARMNAEVNQEWMCNEGRYGFERFQPEARLICGLLRNNTSHQEISHEEAISVAIGMLQQHEGAGRTAVFISPMLSLEEMWVALRFCETVLWTPITGDNVAIGYRSRELSNVERVVVSPDYAPNARAAVLLGVVGAGDSWRESLEAKYIALLERFKQGAFSTALFIGDYCLASQDINEEVMEALRGVRSSIQFGTRSQFICNTSSVEVGTPPLAHVVLPSQTILEKRGVVINRDNRLQRLSRLLTPPTGTFPEWKWLCALASDLERPLPCSPARDERQLFQHIAAEVPTLSGLTLMGIGEKGFTV